jgi:hypothetical protein
LIIVDIDVFQEALECSSPPAKSPREGIDADTGHSALHISRGWLATQSCPDTFDFLEKFGFAVP